MGVVAAASAGGEGGRTLLAQAAHDTEDVQLLCVRAMAAVYHAHAGGYHAHVRWVSCACMVYHVHVRYIMRMRMYGVSCACRWVSCTCMVGIMRVYGVSCAWQRCIMRMQVGALVACPGSLPEQATLMGALSQGDVFAATVAGCRKGLDIGHTVLQHVF